MTLQSSGPINMAQIQGEFGGGAPIYLSEYYKGGGYVNHSIRAPNVPYGGVIRLSNFYGAEYYAPGSIAYTTAGVNYFTVPRGVYVLTVSIIGAGGGAGAGNSDGDAWVGQGGGSGGYYLNWGVGTTPGEVLTCLVGLKGFGASYRFSGSYSRNYTNTGAQVGLGTGIAGGNSYIARGGSVILQPTGGGAGAQYGSGNNGGSPNGVAGQPGSSPSHLGYGFTGTIYGGNNGTGYGTGGNCPGLTHGNNGTDGAILLSW